MAQDGHQGNKDSAAPTAAVTNAPGSPCESTNMMGTTSTPGPAEVVDAVHGEEGGSGGKGSAADVVLATDEGKASKGKRKAAASEKAMIHIMCERERRARLKSMYDELRCLLPHVAKNTDKTTVVDEAISFIKQLEETVENQLEKQKQERALARQGAAADLGAGSSSAAPPPPVAPWATLSRTLPLPQSWSWLPKKKQKKQEQPGAIVAAPPLLTWSESNVRMSVIGDEAHINVRAPRLPGVLQLVLSVLEKHHIDVVTAQIHMCDTNQSIFTFFTRVNVEEINQLDPEAPESKDIYRLAMSEIITWLSNH